MKARLFLSCGVALLGGGLVVWTAQPVAAQAPELVMATVFGPATMRPTESLRACSNNLFGTTEVALRVSVLDAITGAAISAQDLRVPPGRGVCATTNPSNDRLPRAIVVVLSVSANSLTWSNDRRVLSSSVQLLDSDSRSSVFLPAVQFGSSAVQFPTR